MSRLTKLTVLICSALTEDQEERLVESGKPHSTKKHSIRYFFFMFNYHPPVSDTRLCQIKLKFCRTGKTEKKQAIHIFTC